MFMSKTNINNGRLEIPTLEYRVSTPMLMPMELSSMCPMLLMTMDSEFSQIQDLKILTHLDLMQLPALLLILSKLEQWCKYCIKNNCQNFQ